MKINSVLSSSGLGFSGTQSLPMTFALIVFPNCVLGKLGNLLTWLRIFCFLLLVKCPFIALGRFSFSKELLIQHANRRELFH